MEKVVVLSRILCLSFGKSFTGRFLKGSSCAGSLKWAGGCLVIPLVFGDLAALVTLFSEMISPWLELGEILWLGCCVLQGFGFGIFSITDTATISRV